MPSTKNTLTLFAAQALSGGGGPTFSGFLDLRDSYGGIYYITVTNGGIRQSTPVIVEAEIAPNQTAGEEAPFDCRKVATQAANGVSKFAIRIPPEPQFSRLKVSHGDQSATIDVKFDELTQV